MVNLASYVPDELAAVNAPDAPAPDAVDETFLQRVEDVIQEVESVIVQDLHQIEQRCFGRPSADHPVVVTTVTGANNG